MRTLLDEIMDQYHGGGPVIVSEEHDPSKIDAAGRAWDAGEGAGMAAAAAHRMAALDTSGGRVALMVAGKAAWHKLGVNVVEAVDSADALRLAGLNWAVKKQPLSFQHPTTGEYREGDGVFGIVRQDSGAMLGSVGSRDKPFQNADGFAMLDGVLGQSGAKYEAAGSLYGGKRVFMLVKLPEQAFTRPRPTTGSAVVGPQSTGRRPPQPGTPAGKFRLAAFRGRTHR